MVLTLYIGLLMFKYNGIYASFNTYGNERLILVHFLTDKGK